MPRAGELLIFLVLAPATWAGRLFVNLPQILAVGETVFGQMAL
jgi:hypothetical protein